MPHNRFNLNTLLADNTQENNDAITAIHNLLQPAAQPAPVVNIFYMQNPAAAAAAPTGAAAGTQATHHAHQHGNNRPAPLRIEPHPSTYNAVRLVQPELHALNGSGVLLRYYSTLILPQNLQHLAHLISDAPPHDTMPARIRDAIILAATDAWEGLPLGHKNYLESHRIVHKHFPAMTAVELIINNCMTNPILIASAMASPEDRDRARDAGKPFIGLCPICNIRELFRRGVRFFNAKTLYIASNLTFCIVEILPCSQCPNDTLVQGPLSTLFFAFQHFKLSSCLTNQQTPLHNITVTSNN